MVCLVFFSQHLKLLHTQRRNSAFSMLLEYWLEAFCSSLWSTISSIILWAFGAVCVYWWLGRLPSVRAMDEGSANSGLMWCNAAVIRRISIPDPYPEYISMCILGFIQLVISGGTPRDWSKTIIPPVLSFHSKMSLERPLKTVPTVLPLIVTYCTTFWKDANGAENVSIWRCRWLKVI